MMVCDNERAFISNEFKDYCSRLDIKIHTYVMNKINGNNDSTGSRPVHGLLSILDRFCRTLRSMAYNVGILNQEIDPDMMNELIAVYNNSPRLMKWIRISYWRINYVINCFVTISS